MAVYFIRCGKRGPIKIGMAIDPISRLRGLQTSHYERLRLMAIACGFEHWTGDKDVETTLHRIFRDSNIRGEWFWPTTGLVAFLKCSDWHRHSHYCLGDQRFDRNADDYLTRLKPYVVPGIRESRRFLDIYETAEILGLDEKGVKKLLSRKELKPCEKEPLVFFERDVLKLKEDRRHDSYRLMSLRARGIEMVDSAA